MKRNLILIAALLPFSYTMAQYDPEALAVLESMSAKYQNIAAFKADFTQELINESAGINEEISGQITVEGEKYLLEIAGQKIYNNAVNVYSYSEEFEEVTIAPFEPETTEITIGNIYDLYKEGFKYNLMSVNQAGDRIIEMDPESRDKSYFKIRLIIDSQDNLQKFTVFERSGNKYVYSIESFKQVTDLPEDYFTFDTSEYPDVEVIDFR